MASFLKKGEQKQGTLSFKKAPKPTADTAPPMPASAPLDVAATPPLATAPYATVTTELSQLGATAPTLEVWSAVAAETPRLPELTKLLLADFAAELERRVATATAAKRPGECDCFRAPFLFLHL